MIIHQKTIHLEKPIQIIDHRLEGDKEIFTHAQDVLPVMAEAKESRDNFDKSFKLDRFAWPVAKVPALIFKQFMDQSGGSFDEKAFNRWLESDYGRPFKAS
jgi:hypothetical protein